MKRGSPLQTLASSPTMVGAITTLIVIVAVFLAYNANNGLPFVPVYRVSVVVPNAARLVQNNEVRIGGNRVGVVESIEAVRLPVDDESPDAETNGDTSGVVARVNLKLDKAAAPLPQNSIFRIRYRSSFGLKFLEVTRGNSDDMAPEGYIFDGTNDNDDPNDDDQEILSIDELDENEGAADGTFIDQTEFDEIGNTFDQPTRNAIRQNLAGYGDAFAARGHLAEPGDRIAEPAAHQPPAGGADAQRVGDEPAELLPVAGSHCRDRRSGRRGAGRAVRRTWRRRSPRSATTRRP